MSQPVRPTTQADDLILLAQLEALCATLRFLAQMQQEPSNATIELLAKFREDLGELARGRRCIRDFPSVSNSAKAADLLPIAEVLRATASAFLASIKE
jgi:hypothetical protein